MSLVKVREVRTKSFVRDTRGISDAIAVLLFISMVVVVAAVIGAMVLSKTPSGSAPVAQLSIYGMSGRIVIDHLGGDAIDPSSMKIIVYRLPNNTVLGAPISSPAIDVDVDPADIFNVGDKIILDGTDLPGLAAGQYTVRIIFTPLDKPIAENNVYVSS